MSEYTFWINSAQQNKVENVSEFLKKHEPDYICPTRTSSETLLMYAATTNSVDVARLLIDNKADVNKTNEDGTTALLFASSFQNEEMVELLISSGADIKMMNSFKSTASSIAMDRNNQKIFDLLNITPEQECFNFIENGKIDLLEDKLTTVKDVKSVILFCIKSNSLEALKLLQRLGYPMDKECVDAAYSSNDEKIFNLCHEEYYGYELPINCYDGVSGFVDVQYYNEKGELSKKV